MIDKEKRKEEIIKNILWGNHAFPLNIADAIAGDIVSEEQSMIEKLEADKAELLKALKSIPCTCMDAYKDRKLSDPDCPQCNHVDFYLIEKMEE